MEIDPFDKVAIYFSKEEWDYLKEEQKELYKDVMMENYQVLRSLGCVNVKPEIVSMIEQGKEPYVRGHQQYNGNASSTYISTDFTKEHTPQTCCITALNVRNALQVTPILLDIRQFTKRRCLALNVGNSSLLNQLLLHIREFTTEKKHLYVLIVGNVLP
ncbi:hypothetical protein FKM82_005285 [Ascaphus truei]